MKISHLNDLFLYSNSNVEKLARKLVNESSNGLMLEMFDDSAFLADHITGKVYKSDYNFNGKTFEFTNFEEVEIENDNTSLSEAIKAYFDDEAVDLAEAYEVSANTSKDVFEESLVEALASKNMENIIDYSELCGINEEVSEVSEMPFFRLYEERLATHPTSSIKFFDWVNPVRVSLIDEDENVVINKTAKKKAKSLKNDKDFKKKLKGAAEDAVDGDNRLMEELISENQSILALDNAELKELVGMSVIGERNLMENRNTIVNAINTIISEDADFAYKKALFEEEGEEEEGADDKEAAPEVSEKDTEALVKALDKALENITDEKLIKKIEDLKSDLQGAAEAEETDTGAVKEAVELLSF